MANPLTRIFTGMFGSRNQRLLKQYSRQVMKINALEEGVKALSDADLAARTDEFKRRLKEGESLDDLLPEAFATVREAAVRSLHMRHFDVQLIGGMVLHDGNISEMRTGEGKTLVATLAAYLNALTGNSVHIVTVNEYLAGRDANWMGPVYEFLGLTVGVIRSGQNPAEKREAYAADITYGTNNEYGFDYLRDNLAFRVEDKVQRDLTFAVVDEVDSILIDEARTPLIISGPSEESSELYVRINALVPKLKEQIGVDPADQLIPVKTKPKTDDEEDEPDFIPGDFVKDEKGRQVYLTEDGHQKVEQLLAGAGLLGSGDSLYDAANIRLMHHFTAALRAHVLFRRDVDYIVNEGEIVIVDEFTGRTMPGRRWSDGLHQAVEAKEGVRVKEENQTVASITFQNYFRMYGKLAGMTGTADTEAFEFQQIYGLEVVVIPTDKPMVRDDAPDLVFLTEKDKFEAIVEDIKDCHERGQPVLVGTTSIETSERLSKVLQKARVPHNVLNAKQHEREAEIVIQAGRPGKITIATNMAGRGTDIVLGGNLEAELLAADGKDESKHDAIRRDWDERHKTVIDNGGLHIVGTERHESRRIDNQLRGRSGRQGDPGSSRFYLSMEDNLMRIFGNPERTKALLSRVGMKEGEAIESRLLSRQIEKAQRKVEAHNFDARKNLLEYDDVANEQRKVVYVRRNELMAAEEIAEHVAATRDEVINAVMDDYVPPKSVEEMWEIPGLVKALDSDFATRIDVQKWLDEDDALNEEALRQKVVAEIETVYNAKVEQLGEPMMRHLEKAIMLQQLDIHWKEHLAAMDYLRQGIGLRSFGQRNPKQEYKREAFEMFSAMLDQVDREAISILSRVRIKEEEDFEAMEARRREARKMKFQHAEAPSATAMPAAVAAGGGRGAPAARPQAQPQTPFVRHERKIGRNEPCPCGSGKKYKHCHGRLA